MIHPEIKKFWEDSGYVIDNKDQVESSITRGYKSLPDGWTMLKIIAMSGSYHFNKQWYSEEQMLKIIKLKAFH